MWHLSVEIIRRPIPVAGGRTFRYVEGRRELVFKWQGHPDAWRHPSQWTDHEYEIFGCFLTNALSMHYGA